MRVDLALTNLMDEGGLGKVEKSHIDGDEEDFECLINRGEDEYEDNRSDDKKLRRCAASQGFLYFCLQLLLCSKLSPEL